MSRVRSRKALFAGIFTCATFAPAAAFTPPIGSFDPTSTPAQVCALGYAREHRNVPYRMRDLVYDRYGLPRGSRRGYVIDHLVPLELGGTNAIANLWPQPRAAAHRKDLDEDRLHGEVCAGELSLSAARAEIIRLWRR
jgi:hypothetical protein